MTKRFHRWVGLFVSIALLLTMLCSVSVMATETENEVRRDITQEEEDFLLHIGIIKTAGPIQEAETTRGALAQIASRVAQLPEYTGGERFFADVPEDHRYYKEIYALAAAGILAGDGDGKFRPDDPVTPVELCKVYSVILGYDVIGQYETFPVIANRIGLTDGMELGGNVTVGQMLKMACNALDLETTAKKMSIKFRKALPLWNGILAWLSRVVL